MSFGNHIQLEGWGRFPRVLVQRWRPASVDALRQGRLSTPCIARGLGRSYGDSSLQPALTIDMTACRNMLAFDAQTGELTVEAGVSAAEILEVFVPRGWFLPVTPGTKFVSIGGMIAADVHGKNHHHAGTIAHHLSMIEVLREDGKIVTCSATRNADLFWATCGGMGLTGVILTATLRLKPINSAYIHQQTFAAPDLQTVMALFEEHASAPYSVAWIDCMQQGTAMGRSLVYIGRHAEPDELPADLRQKPLIIPVRRPLSIPFTLPAWLLNKYTIKAFNALYYERGKRSVGARIIDYDRYFYPLDSVYHWNRLYGSRGFTQYQCVLPKATSAEGLRRLLDTIAAAGSGSFLAVLKLFGKKASGALSFPMEGYTLALDFPATSKNLKLQDMLDAIVLQYGGRVYLAKDARLPAAIFKKMYASGLPALDAQRCQPYQSLQSERLAI